MLAKFKFSREYFFYFCPPLETGKHESRNSKSVKSFGED